jgi:integrase/recombinase XerD
MRPEELLHRFQDDLQTHNYSIRTVSDYGYNLGLLFQFLAQRQISDIQAITTAILAEFQHWVYYQPTKRGAARGVVNQNAILAAVKSFCRFLKTEGYLVADPAEPVEYAREPRSLPRNVLTPQEAKRILETVDTTTILGYRDRTILEVLYETGIRNQELRRLTVNDVNLEEGLLRINDGKGGKDRLTPLGPVALRFLETYLKGIRPQLAGNHNTDRLFLSYRGNAIDAHSLGDLVKAHADLAKIKRKHVTPHVWRHTCATHMVANNANLRHVQEMLGHESLATTEKYLRLTITDLKAAHAKFHPREKGA